MIDVIFIIRFLLELVATFVIGMFVGAILFLAVYLSELLREIGDNNE